MNKKDIRIDTIDSEKNIHEIYITHDTCHLIIYSMDRNGRVIHKDYGVIHPIELQNRAYEMLQLARELLKIWPDD